MKSLILSGELHSKKSITGRKSNLYKEINHDQHQLGPSASDDVVSSGFRKNRSCAI
jgi:hypothetical protein